MEVTGTSPVLLTTGGTTRRCTDWARSRAAISRWWIPGASRDPEQRSFYPGPLGCARMDELLGKAVDAATAAGADYADVRIIRSETESLSVNGPSVESLERSDSEGLGVRVLVNGAWGYASSASLGSSDAARIAELAVEVGR